MLRHKNWLFLTLSIISFALVITITINYIMDPFGIFGTNILKYQFQVNERYCKAKFLKKNHDRFDSYLLGSSRIGTTHPSTVGKYIPGSRFYNYTVASATLYDDMIHLEYFIKQGYAIRNIYLQVDILDNFTQYRYDDSDLLRKEYPEITGKNLFSYYLPYLMTLPVSNIKNKISLNMKNKYDTIFDIEDTGMWFKPNKTKAMETDPDKYIQNEPLFHKKHHREVKSSKTAQNLAELKKIKELCRENNINLIVFVTPHNQHMMDSFDLDDYYTFLRDMADITNYWDFSGYNSITTNDHNYYEDSHYTGEIAQLVAARIFDDKNTQMPYDFGILVTKNNIEEHIQSLKKQIPDAGN